VLGKTGRKSVLMAGIEAHVCVYQTACDLIARGYRVEVVADAVSSRSPRNLQIGLERIRAAGGYVTCMEMALFELMRTSTHPAFRDILKLVR
jgi:nicotinamidase-related amidase